MWMNRKEVKGVLIYKELPECVVLTHVFFFNYIIIHLKRTNRLCAYKYSWNAKISN